MAGNEERDYLGSAALAATVVDDDNDDVVDVVGTNVLASDDGNVAGVAETVEGGGAGGGGYDTGQVQQGEAAEEEETEGDEQHDDDDTLVGAGCGDTAALTATDELTIDAAATAACLPASNLDVSDSAPIKHCTSSDHGSHGDDDDGGGDHGQNDSVFAGAGIGAGTGDSDVAWASPSTSVTTDAAVSLHVERHDDTSAPTEAQKVTVMLTPMCQLYTLMSKHTCPCFRCRGRCVRDAVQLCRASWWCCCCSASTHCLLWT